ncbi:MAG: hypothetical protein MRERV_77c001, partial [Mycoplasmataceae bacterium RV_VA103A]
MNQNKSKNPKKHFLFLIINGIFLFFLLLTIVLFIGRNKKKEETSSENQLQLNQGAPPFADQEQSNCPYLDEKNLTTVKGICKMILNEKEDLPKWKQIPKIYIIKLWKKGYHWYDIIQLWEWKIPETDIPNLKAEKTIGTINTLSYVLGLPCSVTEKLKTMPKAERDAWRKKMENDELGSTIKAIFIVRKSLGGKINLDKKITGASPYGDTQKYVKELIEFVLQKENLDPQQWEVSVLNC